MKIKEKHFLAVIPLIYFVSCIFLLPSIGLGWDTTVNLAKGEQVYNFLQTLNPFHLVDGFYKSRYFNEVPHLYNGHPPAFSFISFTIGNFLISIFGFKYYFFHVANILLSTVFIYYWGKFTVLFYEKNKKTHEKFLNIGVLSQLLLISVPSFFIHSIVNPKDLPVVVFSFFSIYLLYTLSNKNFSKNFSLSLFFYTLSLATKLTSIFFVPILLLLGWKHRSIFINNIKKTIFYIPAVTIFTLILFWPQLIFNTGYEWFRVNYFYLGVTNVKETHSFAAYLISALPEYLIFLIALGFITYFKVKDLTLRNLLFILFWFFSLSFYFIYSSKFYDGIRQFLFVLLPLTLLASSTYYIFLKNKFTYYGAYVISILLFFYTISSTPYQLTYSNNIFNLPKTDYWQLSLPLGIDFVTNKYTNKSIHFIPVNYLLKYYDLGSNRISEDFITSDILITTTNNYWYNETKFLREEYFNKLNFEEGLGFIEVWERK